MPRIHSIALAAAFCGAIGFGAGSAHATASVCDAIAGNLVQDCGFEQSFGGQGEPDGQSPPGWTYTQALSGAYSQTSGNPHSGSLAWSIGAYGGEDDVLSQTLTTTPGASYIFSFFQEGNSTTTGNHLIASWDGGAVLNITNDVSSSYVEESFTVVANGTGSDTISIGGNDLSGYIYLDDVSVTAAVPEPASLMLMGAGLAALGAARRRRRRG